MLKNINKFDKAKKLIDLMLASSNLDEYEGHWKEFLHKLDKGFNKLDDLFKNDNRVREVIDSIKTARKSDPLIAYLMQARNSDEHSVRQIAKRVEGHTKISGGVGGGKIIKGTFEGGKLPTNLITEGNVEIELAVDRLNIIPVINRGRQYDPPLICSGVKINTQIPHAIAAIGLTFYNKKIFQIERLISSHPFS
jgi:hypothetical protein